MHATPPPVTEPNATKSKRKAQFRVYDTCLQKHLHRHTWMGFIDVDEFIVLPSQQQGGVTAGVLAGGRTGAGSVAEVLRPYEQYGGVGINLKIFGSSGEYIHVCVYLYV